MKTGKLLYEELSYKIRGAFFSVANTYGKGLKEIIYQKALAEEFEKLNIPFEREKRINIYSVKTGKLLGTYLPDFVVDNKIVIEIKATDFPNKLDIEQQLSYLKSSNYEIGYLVNFGTPRLYIKRTIYTNDRKNTDKHGFKATD
ncbi:MAG: GxxExxY protein [Candidatus Paceibacterota bacterium]